MSQYNTWYHPHPHAEEYSKRVAYFSMEFAIEHPLKTYSGGLGFLAGSHMRSAYDLRQNVIGIGMLWKYGYYDQGRNTDATLRPHFIEKNYSFLEDTGIEVQVRIFDNPSVKIRAYVLRPETLGSIPIYFLTTDLDSNDHLSRSITSRLYDPNELTRISQSIVLGIGGAKVVEQLGGADIYHLNEGHGLPAFFHLKNQGISKEKKVFTTHTPEKAGNEERNAALLNEMGFFGRHYAKHELREVCLPNGMLSYTVAALRMAGKSNAVSQLHGKVSHEMWSGFEGTSEIISITNAQHQHYWQDKEIRSAWESRDKAAFSKRKRILKQQLLDEVLDQTGKMLDPEALTIVWARRFAAYKRPDLLLHDIERLEAILSDTGRPVQVIWSGKPYPEDHAAIDIFNRLVHFTRYRADSAVLVGYEMKLSRILKMGSDVWLNTPRITREASGTSGMSAAFNGTVNLTINDGWIPEFARHPHNSFVLPALDHTLPVEEQDRLDAQHLYELLENTVVPMYYDNYEQWLDMAFNALDDVVPAFTSHRMAAQYYEELYK